MKTYKFISAATLVLSLSACGNYAGPVRTVGSHSSSGIPSSQINTDGTTTENGYTCPASPNVLPNGNTIDPNAADRFKVCTPTNTNDQQDIVVHGSTSVSNTVCVFPVQYVDENHIYAKPDVTTGLPWYKCQSISGSAGLSYAFPSISWNAAFIVENPYVDAMQRCLYTFNLATCPQFSYGKFR